MNKSLLLPALLLIILGCKEKPLKSAFFESTLSEKTMLLNHELDNSIEGFYFNVDSGGGTNHIKIGNLTDSLPISDYYQQKWVVGWGMKIPLFDGGVENIREITGYIPSKKIIILGNFLRGEGFPGKNEKIVFWNCQPSGFKKTKPQPIIDFTAGWKGFSGKSISFSKIFFDSVSNQWIMYLNEVDTTPMATYAAGSQNLEYWHPLFSGKPILTGNVFTGISWCGFDKNGTTQQSAQVSDVIKTREGWVFIADGYNQQGLRQIGTIFTKDPVNGPFIPSKDPIIKVGNSGQWDEAGCFSAKVVQYKNQYLLYYDGISANKAENIGLAVSTDLRFWQKYGIKPVISNHYGWNSKKTVSEPAYVCEYNGQIQLYAAGAKEFNQGWWHHYILNNIYLEKKGNVDDTEIGLFVSEDGGFHFTTHSNNPVFVNNFTDNWENEHLGANFQLIENNGYQYLFYQAKTSNDGLVYKPFFRKK